MVLKNTVIIGTNRLPLKNDKAIGNSTSLNLLKEYAAINPIIIPRNTLELSIFVKPKLTAFSFILNNVATFSGFNTFVTIAYPNAPAKATAPSFFLAIPIATPIAKINPNCPKIAVPTIEKNMATVGRT